MFQLSMQGRSEVWLLFRFLGSHELSVVAQPALLPTTQAMQTRRWQPGSAKSADHQAGLWESWPKPRNWSQDPGLDQQDLCPVMGMVVVEIPSTAVM